VTARARRSWLAGLIGHGVRPSLTPELHEREAQRQGLRYVYKVIELPDVSVDSARLERLLAAAVELGYDGLNITHPVKQAVVPLIDELDPAVAAIGALNTVLIRGGRTIGHNTDVTGFRKAFEGGLPHVDSDRVLLLGAGGAGTAVAHALADLGVAHLSVFDPDRQRGSALRSSLTTLPTEVELLDVDGLGAALKTSAGVVNATPIGMAAHPGSPLPDELLHPDLWLADIVYRPLDTALLRAARAAGCTVLNGAAMAVHQAADAFELITGLPADRQAMHRDFDELVAAETPDLTTREAPRGDIGERNS
jgi:shikimate dehydrogenase